MGPTEDLKSAGVEQPQQRKDRNRRRGKGYKPANSLHPTKVNPRPDIERLAAANHPLGEAWLNIMSKQEGVFLRDQRRPAVIWFKCGKPRHPPIIPFGDVEVVSLTDTLICIGAADQDWSSPYVAPPRGSGQQTGPVRWYSRHRSSGLGFYERGGIPTIDMNNYPGGRAVVHDLGRPPCWSEPYQPLCGKPYRGRELAVEVEPASGDRALFLMEEIGDGYFELTVGEHRRYVVLGAALDDGRVRLRYTNGSLVGRQDLLGVNNDPEGPPTVWRFYTDGYGPKKHFRVEDPDPAAFRLDDPASREALSEALAMRRVADEATEETALFARHAPRVLWQQPVADGRAPRLFRRLLDNPSPLAQPDFVAWYWAGACIGALSTGVIGRFEVDPIFVDFVQVRAINGGLLGRVPARTPGTSEPWLAMGLSLGSSITEGQPLIHLGTPGDPVDPELASFQQLKAGLGEDFKLFFASYLVSRAVAGQDPQFVFFADYAIPVALRPEFCRVEGAFLDTRERADEFGYWRLPPYYLPKDPARHAFSVENADVWYDFRALELSGPWD